MPATPTLDSLPDDILCVIFSYLRRAPFYSPLTLSPGLADAISLSCVNARLRRAFQRQLRAIQLTFPRTRVQQCYENAARVVLRLSSTALRTLSVQGVVTPSLISFAAASCLQLQVLHVFSVHTITDTVWAAALREWGASLRKVSVTEADHFGDAAVSALSHFAPQIHSLTLARLPRVSSDALGDLLRVCGSTLHEVSLNLSFDAGPMVAGCCQWLTHLSLGGPVAGNNCVEACVKSGNSLQVASFEDAHVTEVQVREIVGVCRNLNELSFPTLDSSALAKEVGSRLKRLCLRNAIIRATDLSDIALRCTNVEEVAVEYSLGFQEKPRENQLMLALVDLCASIGKQLHTLSIKHLPVVDDKTLAELGRVTGDLHHVQLDGLDAVTTTGVNNFLRHTGSSLRSISIGPFCKLLSNVSLMKSLSLWCHRLEFVSFPRWGCAQRVPKDTALLLALDNFRRNVPFATIQQE